MKIIYAPTFFRAIKRIDHDLREEVIEKTELFEDKVSRKNLKIHKLHGKHKDCYAFSVNYRTRIIFQYLSKDTVAFLTVGDHQIYQ